MRTLIVLAIAAAVSACAHGGGLAPGHLVAGQLAQTDQEFPDGSHYRMFQFQGRAGDTITARLTSEDFDANLILTDAHGNHLADDDGGDCNARLTITFTQSGSYQVLVNTAAPRATGPFRLSVQAGAPASASSRPACNRE